jgi:hypothetical protein
MKSGLDAEKRAMEKIWKTREKQIERVILNTAHMYGSIKGIAGDAIETVKALELGEGLVEDELNGETDDLKIVTIQWKH